MTYFVYLMASKRSGTLYLGVTNDVARRAYEHKSKQNAGFTSRYGVDRLVWYEQFEDIRDAIDRERF
jgi:putative endonuclease